jgi:hypothetical protein
MGAAASGTPCGAPTSDAAAQFSWLASFFAVDTRPTSALTRRLLDWQPTHPRLIEDLEQGHYFDDASSGMSL